MCRGTWGIDRAVVSRRSCVLLISVRNIWGIRTPGRVVRSIFFVLPEQEVGALIVVGELEFRLFFWSAKRKI